MSLHKDPHHNSPEIHGALRAHGMKTDQPDILADAFRLGWAANTPNWEAQRCAECDCEFGGADCNWIKTPPLAGNSTEEKSEPEMQWIKTSDRLPKKPGKASYEYVDCMILVKGELKFSPWNCEHECWDDSSYDDWAYDALTPSHWMEIKRPMPK